MSYNTIEPFIIYTCMYLFIPVLRALLKNCKRDQYIRVQMYIGSSTTIMTTMQLLRSYIVA